MRNPVMQWRVLFAVAVLLLLLWAALLFSIHDAAPASEPVPLPDWNGAQRADGVEAAATQRDESLAPTTVAGGSGAPHRPWSHASHLIIVAGHTVFMGRDMSSASADTEEDWYLVDYQRGQLKGFLDHIKEGVRLAAADPASLLIFSGGATRDDAGPRTEGSSYWLWAEAHKWFSKTNATVAADVKQRAHTEEFARDSFENLLYSICRFRQLTGSYPAHITMVSLPFKEHRFREVHRHAIRYPRQHFSFVGVGASSEAAVAGERTRSLLPYERDPYGCRDPLSTKKRARDPFLRARPYPQGCPELAALFQACSSHVFQGPLPWKSD